MYLLNSNQGLKYRYRYPYRCSDFTDISSIDGYIDGYSITILIPTTDYISDISIVDGYIDKNPIKIYIMYI